MSSSPNPPQLPSARTDALRGLVLLVVVVLGLSWSMRGCMAEADSTSGSAASSSAPAAISSSAAPSTAPTSSPSPAPDPTVPDVTGITLDVAQDRLWSFQQSLSGSDRSVRAHDLSPRSRDQYIDRNWTVVTTRPAVGEPWTSGTRLHMFVLKNEEAAWFAAHPKMPAVPEGVPVTDLTEEGQLFAGLDELLDYRHAPGEPGDGASHPPDDVIEPIEGLVDSPSTEPAAERRERTALAPAYGSYAKLTVGSLPAAAAPVRAGRLITLTVRDAPTEPVPAPPDDTSTGGVGGGYSDGDDDVNIPGWLCPTRFC